MITVRPAAARGHANLGWLDTRYSFSFANYYDLKHMGFRDLRVINEDVVQAETGFGLHPHHNMEIITYIVDGELSHRDSMGREATLKQHDVQRMSAGTGILHSEYNNSQQPVHLLQIWILPEAEGLKPSYEDLTVPAAEKRNALRLLASREGGDNSVKINQDVSVYASLLDPDRNLELPLGPGRHAWVQVVRGDLDVNGTRLVKGDGAAISDEGRVKIANVGRNGEAELLLFDLA